MYLLSLNLSKLSWNYNESEIKEGNVCGYNKLFEKYCKTTFPIPYSLKLMPKCCRFLKKQIEFII